ncbi:silver transporter [Solibacillus silvestris]|uniref:silver transporter n=1 Tax=Solibacillus silvestris TaxID=76853 RepID=UPI003F823528
MIFIVKVNPARNIYEQVKWKCKAYSSMFSTVLIVHMLLALLSGGHTGSMGMGRGFVNYREQYYSMDPLFIYSVIMMLFIGWMLASKVLTRDNFSIVATNRTEIISTWLFLVVHAVFTLFSAICTLSISVFIDIVRTGDILMLHSSDVSIISLAGFVVCILLAASVGYFLHVVFDFSKVVFVLLGAAIFLLIRQYTIDVWEMLFGSSSVQILGRSVMYMAILWGLVLLIRQQREVMRS